MATLNNIAGMYIRYLKFLIITLFCLVLTGCDQDSVKDIDGNVYPTVVIGTQVWMAKNLRTTRYSNGDLIGTTTPATLIIEDEESPGYQWAYGGDDNNLASYGRLYTWYVAADSKNVCPTGWHVPSDEEWTTLTNYLIKNVFGYGTGYNGMDIAKSLSATAGWVADDSLCSVGNNQRSNNRTGFTALPGGARFEDGNFYLLGHVGNWWSTTEGKDKEGKGAFMQGLSGILVYTPGGVQRTIYHDYCYVNSYSNNKKCGMSIRCLKDN